MPNIINWVQIWRAVGHSFFSMKPFSCSDALR